jgi:hypothetical protein
MWSNRSIALALVAATAALTTAGCGKEHIPTSDASPDRKSVTVKVYDAVPLVTALPFQPCTAPPCQPVTLLVDFVQGGAPVTPPADVKISYIGPDGSQAASDLKPEQGIGGPLGYALRLPSLTSGTQWFEYKWGGQKSRFMVTIPDARPQFSLEPDSGDGPNAWGRRIWSEWSCQARARVFTIYYQRNRDGGKLEGYTWGPHPDSATAQADLSVSERGTEQAEDNEAGANSHYLMSWPNGDAAGYGYFELVRWTPEAAQPQSNLDVNGDSRVDKADKDHNFRSVTLSYGVGTGLKVHYMLRNIPQCLG